MSAYRKELEVQIAEQIMLIEDIGDAGEASVNFFKGHLDGLCAALHLWDPFGYLEVRFDLAWAKARLAKGK